MTITPGQLKIARQLLGWTALKVAVRVGVCVDAILAFEAGDAAPQIDLILVREMLKAAGVEFIAVSGGGAAVMRRKEASVAD